MSKVKLFTSVAAIIGVLGGMAACSFPSTAPSEQVDPDSVTYQDFLSYDRSERVRIFNEVSAERRAELVKTRFQLYLAENRSRLTENQTQVIEEILDLLVPQIYQMTAERVEAIRNSDDPEREFFSEQERRAQLMELTDKARRLSIGKPFGGVASW